MPPKPNISTHTYSYIHTPAPLSIVLPVRTAVQRKQTDRWTDSFTSTPPSERTDEMREEKRREKNNPKGETMTFWDKINQPYIGNSQHGCPLIDLKSEVCLLKLEE